MSHVFVDQEKSINVVVELYKKINNDIKNIETNIATDTITFLDLVINFK